MSAAPFNIIEFFNKRHERARLLKKGEVIPPVLEVGFDLLGQLNHNWIWVLDVEGKIEGVLVASECHGIALIWRLVLSPRASRVALIRLLRVFLHDMRKRGMKGYLTFLSLERENELALSKLIKKSGGIQAGGEKLVMMASPLPREGL